MSPSRTWLWLFLGVAIVLGLVWQFFPLSDASQRINSLPLLTRKVVGRNLPLTDFERDIFHNVGVLKRLYKVGDQTLFITALDGTRNRHVVHDPLYCFKGGGWQVDGEETVSMPQGEGKWLSLKRKDTTQDAMYWFSDGESHYASPMRYWLQATLRRLTLGKSGNEPVLIVVQPVDAKTFDRNHLFERFPELLQL